MFGADLNQIKIWISKGAQGEATLVKMHDGLAELATFIEQGEHLDWSVVADETQLPAGALVRKSGQRSVHGSGGAAASPAVAPAVSALARYHFTGEKARNGIPMPSMAENLTNMRAMMTVICWLRCQRAATPVPPA